MKPLAALSLIALLGACGADGEPITPTFNAGLGVSPSGVNLNGRLGLNVGPLTIGLGL